ncbi:hypothetical protein D6856_13945 [Butyrivibrio sp. XB500-5]|uniref:hypothetical protein n=1 Tax=Butyrivibrio sp. XB500-5 TaxID=2364880 RepID=UPI000EAA01FD|nr:hypothetical protein [Butyrivibrio sp. XB500-5]RKM57753.1 hypothetical protein D6856_13945 [Butyrivibrio sp. XB500-5]
MKELESKTVVGECVCPREYEITIRGAAVVITMDPSSSVEELLFHQSDKRIEAAVNYWEKQGEYEYSHMFFDREQIIDMYKCAENGTDAEFIDDLLRTDGTYKEVFDVDPDKMSSKMTMVFGQYGNTLASLAYLFGKLL